MVGAICDRLTNVERLLVRALWNAPEASTKTSEGTGKCSKNSSSFTRNLFWRAGDTPLLTP
jgi:hypothetical protein